MIGASKPGEILPRSMSSASLDFNSGFPLLPQSLRLCSPHRPHLRVAAGAGALLLSGPRGARIAPAPGAGEYRRMAYDEGLAGRIRELLAGERSVAEKEMFGGLAFLIGGNMAVAASGQGGLLVRVDPAESESLVASTPARLMVMGGRQMAGWLRLDSEHVRTKRELATWVRRGATFAASLPAKGPRGRDGRKRPAGKARDG